ncbi:hypothetical protein [Brachybacterium sacelli]|uniref:Uncharacterized protein n=2 Tax=Brachybacterium sacelli TaxID=173364 RepID=A0ABS4X7J2_9MICO|nr:hypothetical protein [Brachybacterium sacelli]MBP2384450.1 hypothetical protein [Brachybacterium sacelli]
MSENGTNGSIYFPERLHSADEHLAWWSTVPVPDEVLQSVMDDYSNSRVVTVNSIVGKYQRMQKQPEWSDAEYAARVKDDSLDFDRRVQQLKERIPEKLDRFAVRDAVRTHLAWSYRYTLPADEQAKVEQAQVTVGDFRGTPAEVSTHYAMPGFAARHPEAFTRLPDDNAAVRQQLAQLRAQIDAVDTTTKKMYVSDMVEQGYTADQIEADLRGERPGAPVGGRKALKSFKKG